MLRLIKHFIFLFVVVSNASAATYYVDKRCTHNGDGTADSCAPGAGGVGAINDIQDAMDRTATVPNGSHTVHIVDGSGPYTTADYVGFAVGNFRPNHQSGSVITWNWNNNENDLMIDVNGGSYEWHESSIDGEYYLTASGGGEPEILGSVFSAWYAVGLLSDQPTVCVIDGVWNSESMSLTGNNPSYLTTNWGWRDGTNETPILGFSTLYVKLPDGSDPTSSGYEILINTSYANITTMSGFGNHIFKNGIFIGAQNAIAGIATEAKFENCIFKYSNEEGIELGNTGASNTTVRWCQFLYTGHRAINFNDDNITGVTAYNNYAEGCHLFLLLDGGSTGGCMTVYNTRTHNLYAGAIQHEDAGNTLVEGGNQWHIDPDSEHGSNGLAFPAGGTPQWTTTAATDFPPSTSTADDAGVDWADTMLSKGVFIKGFHDTAAGQYDYSKKSIPFGYLPIGATGKSWPEVSTMFISQD